MTSKNALLSTANVNKKEELFSQYLRRLEVFQTLAR